MDSFTDASVAARAGLTHGLLAVEAFWAWRQDRYFRTTRVIPIVRSPSLDPRRVVGIARWQLPESQPLEGSWADHRDVLASRLPFRNFRYLVFADGDGPRCFSDDGEPQFDEHGRFDGYRGTTRELTQQWLQECRLRETQGLLQVAAAVARFGAWSVDVRTHQVTWTETPDLFRRGCGPAPAAQMLELYAPEHRDLLRSAYHRCVDEGVPMDVEVEALTANRRRKWVRITGVPMRGRRGDVTRVQGAYQDIHKAKAAADAHRAAAQRLRTTLDSLADGFLTVDRQWRITYVNPAALEILRMDDTALLGRVFWEAFPDAEHGEFGRHYREALAHDRVCRFEAEYAPMSMWFRVSAFPSHQGLAISFTDITAAHHARTRLLETNAALERSIAERTEALRRTNEELATFTMAVAHDLRPPLAAVQGFSRALQERLPPGDDAQLQHFASRIRAGVARMEQLLDELLELSQVGRAELLPRWVDLGALARCALEQLRIQDPGRAVQVDIADGLSAWGDARLLRILVDKLLRNAWQGCAALQPGRIALRQGEGGVFEMRDNGAGIDARRANELFAPKGESGEPVQCAGLGMALASARRIVERHGGRIWAVSPPDGGAAFCFFLPPPDQKPAASPSRRESDAIT